MGELKRQRQNLENNCRGRERIKKKKKKKTTLLTEQQDTAVFSSEAMQAGRQGKRLVKAYKLSAVR